ncbi:Golgi-associated plant pathogenesis-related protein 1-like [Ptychodera flava]|uniref:Golgi-associated plant pathogenesis-related protein 1-like n=1 Tax=Ptychodera flava TaxID=63121 RepID=UPI003969D6F9
MSEGAFQEDCVAAHNKYRRLHGVPELSLSEELATSAQMWADRIVERGYLQNSDNVLFGENILLAVEDVSGEEVADLWYNEEENYDYEQSRWNRDCRHFTQMVWKSCTDIGVGKARMRDDGKFVIVIHYKPCGNNNGRGEFKKNVVPKI